MCSETGMMVRIDPPSAEAMRDRPVYGIMVLGGLIEVVGAALLRSAPLGHGRQPSMRPTFIKLHNSDPIFRNQIGRGGELALIIN